MDNDYITFSDSLGYEISLGFICNSGEVSEAQTKSTLYYIARDGLGITNLDVQEWLDKHSPKYAKVFSKICAKLDREDKMYRLKRRLKRLFSMWRKNALRIGK